MGNRQLERSTIETWFAAILGIAAAVIPMDWQWETGLLAVAWGLLCDIILHSGWGKQKWWPVRYGLCLAALYFLQLIAWPSFIQRYLEHSSTKILPEPLWSLTGFFVGSREPLVVWPIAVLSALIALSDFAPVWRIRHRALFRFRRFWVAEVWISEHEALDIVTNSSWARNRKARNDRTLVNWWANLNLPVTTTRSAESRESMYLGWCLMALRQFEEQAPHAVREKEEGGREIEESALRGWIQGRYDVDLIKEFGTP